jgi:outer membrane lipoprotein SlyB
MNRIAVAASAALFAAAAHGQQTAVKGTSIILYGNVQAAEPVKLDTSKATGGGAIVGGLVGLAIEGGRGHDEKLAGAAGGALLGGVLSKHAAGKHKAEAFTVKLNDGTTIKVVQDAADIAAGDCVAVEQGSTANIRRVSDAMCTAGPHQKDPTITASHSQDAKECDAAKQELLKASSDSQASLAEKKVQVLCQ